MLEDLTRAHTANYADTLSSIHRNEANGSDTLIHTLASFSSRENALYGEERLRDAMIDLAPLGFVVFHEGDKLTWQWNGLSGQGEYPIQLLANALVALLKMQR